MSEELPSLESLVSSERDRRLLAAEGLAASLRLPPLEDLIDKDRVRYLQDLREARKFFGVQLSLEGKQVSALAVQSGIALDASIGRFFPKSIGWILGVDYTPGYTRDEGDGTVTGPRMVTRDGEARGLILGKSGDILRTKIASIPQPRYTMLVERIGEQRTNQHLVRVSGGIDSQVIEAEPFEFADIRLKLAKFVVDRNLTLD